jgi:hypothetical protein
LREDEENGEYWIVLHDIEATSSACSDALRRCGFALSVTG